MLRQILHLTFSFAWILSPVLMAMDESLLSYSEFRQLAEDLSKKVNLFESIWMEDPKAEFFGGTSRDFSYWLRGQFRGLKSRTEVEAKIVHLRNLPLIDARSFIVGDSDVDLASNHSSFQKMAQIFLVRRIDQVSSDRFMEDTEAGRNELHQGYIPVEKIRLTRNGFTSWFSFKDGLREIYDGKPSVRFSHSQEFDSTKYAKEGLNHPVLLALRYLRILSVNYFQIEGHGYPNEKKLLDIDAASALVTQEIVEAALKDSRLRRLLENPQFRKWMNATVIKAFRSYTNPTAAFKLYQYFKADLLVSKFSKFLEPLNQYLFAKPPLSEWEQQDRMSGWGFHASEVLIDIKNEFPDFLFVHGVKTGSASYRSVLREGILPSERGLAGRGLYGVSMQNKKFSEDWAGSRENVVEFSLSPLAKMVDISKGAGRALFRKFKKSEDEFCDYFGIQILKYPYFVDAFVVKDSSILGKARPLYNKTITVSEIFDQVDSLTNAKDALELLGRADQIQLTYLEHKLFGDLVVTPWILPELKLMTMISFHQLLDFLSVESVRYLSSASRELLISEIDLEKYASRSYSDLSLDEISAIFSHRGIQLFSKEKRMAFYSLFKKHTLIPRLKEQAHQITDWKNIQNFISNLCHQNISDQERREIIDMISVPWFHEGPMSESRKMFLSRIELSLRNRSSGFLPSLRLTLAISLLAHFLSSPDSENNKQNILDAKRQYFTAIQDVTSSIELDKLIFRLGSIAKDLNDLGHIEAWLADSIQLNQFLIQSLKDPSLSKAIDIAISIGKKWRPDPSIWREIFGNANSGPSPFTVMAGSGVVLLFLGAFNLRLSSIQTTAVLLASAGGLLSAGIYYLSVDYGRKRGSRVMKAIQKEFQRLKKCSKSIQNLSGAP